MKQKLDNLIKTTKPLKDKVSDLIEDNFSPSKKGYSKLSIFPLKNKLPSIDLEQSENRSPIINNTAEQSAEARKRVTRQISDLSQNVDSTRKMLESILNTTISNKHNKTIADITNNIQKRTNSNSIENVFNKNDMNSLIQNISSTRNENTTTSPNYIKSSVSIPFITNETNNNENVDASIKNIKVSKPTISKFSNMTKAGSQFTKENKYFTNTVQSMLENSPTIKVFERGKNILKTTKEVMNHITTRQNNVVPMLEYGGMVNSPTLAMIGESGPETVLPTSMAGKSSVSIPFITNETNNNENVDASIKNIKVSKPTISKFSNMTKAGSQFTKENKYFTNTVQSMLENSPTIKVFERGKNILKTTKEVMNHITTRQNNVVPMLEYGGMVNSPTLAMIGESGPETVLPTSMAGSSPPFSPTPQPYKLQSPMAETGNDKNISLKDSFDSISKSASGSFDSNKIKLGAEKQNSITSLANNTLQERASYQAQSTANNIKSTKTKESPVTLQAKEFARPTTTKQTAPAAGAAGAEAGSSAFSTYFRNRIFSLPSWRQRLS